MHIITQTTFFTTVSGWNIPVQAWNTKSNETLFKLLLSWRIFWQNSVNLLCLQISWGWTLLSKGLQDMFSGWLVASWYSHSSNDRNVYMPWRPQDEIVLVQLKISRINKELLFCKESHLPGCSVFNQNFPRCHKLNPKGSHNACLDCLKCRKHQCLSTMKSSSCKKQLLVGTLRSSTARWQNKGYLT